MHIPPDLSLGTKKKQENIHREKENLNDNYILLLFVDLFFLSFSAIISSSLLMITGNLRLFLLNLLPELFPPSRYSQAREKEKPNNSAHLSAQKNLGLPKKDKRKARKA